MTSKDISGRTAEVPEMAAAHSADGQRERATVAAHEDEGLTDAAGPEAATLARVAEPEVAVVVVAVGPKPGGAEVLVVADGAEAAAFVDGAAEAATAAASLALCRRARRRIVSTLAECSADGGAVEGGTGAAGGAFGL